MNEHDAESSDKTASSTESFGSAPGSGGAARPADPAGDGPQPREEMGEAPPPTQTIGDAPAPAPAGSAGGKNTSWLVGGGIAVLAVLGILVALVAR